LFLRLSTMGVRFSLVFFLAKFLDPEDVGLYGLIAASLTYSIFVVGVDFYTFSIREIAGANLSDVGGYIKNQFALSVFLYLLYFPFAAILFYSGFLPVELIAIFTALLVFEHLSQELGRLLIALNSQVAASLVLFIRQGVWAALLVIAMLYWPSARQLEWVLMAWLGGCFLAVTVGGSQLLRSGVSGWCNRVDYRWIRKGVKVALPFLLASLAFRSIGVFDRYILEGLAGLQIVAVYVLFYGFSNAMIALLDAGVLSFAYPSLVAAVKNGKSADYRAIMQKMTLHTLVLVTGFSVLSVLLLPFILVWIGRDIYIEYDSLYFVMLCAIICNAIAMIPHYGLYSHRNDRPIIVANVAALPVFLGFTFLFSNYDKVLSVPLGFLSASFFMMAFKLVSYFKITPKAYLRAEV